MGASFSSQGARALPCGRNGPLTDRDFGTPHRDLLLRSRPPCPRFLASYTRGTMRHLRVVGSSSAGGYLGPRATGLLWKACREGQPSQPAPRGLSGQHARRSGRRHPRPSASLPYHDVGLQRLGPPCGQRHLSFCKFLIVYFLEPRFLGCVLHTRGQGAYAERDRVPTPSPSTSPLRWGGPCKARVARLLLSFLLSASAPVTRLLLGPSSAFRPQAQYPPTTSHAPALLLHGHVLAAA